MSVLIDELFIEEHPKAQFCSDWYIARPIIKSSLLSRIIEAFKVIRGECRTYHYYEDEIDTYGVI